MTCKGAGEVEVGIRQDGFGNWDTEWYECPGCSDCLPPCDGTGEVQGNACLGCSDCRFSLVQLCGRCMAGAGGECHTPGCALWMNRAPDVPVTLEPVQADGGAATAAQAGAEREGRNPKGRGGKQR